MKLLSLTINGKTITAPPSLPQPKPGGVEKILSNFITIFLTAGIIVSVLFIAWGGIQWITSGGDKQKLASARAHITWAIIGLVIMLLSFAFIRAFESMLGVSLLNYKF